MKTVAGISVLGLVLTALSCSSGPFSRGPGKTLTTALMAANEGKYSEADEYLSSDLKQLVHGNAGAMAGGSKGIWDQGTKNGTIQRVEIVKEEIRGEGAKVTANIYFKDGSVKSGDESEMIKEKGAWKIAK